MPYLRVREREPLELVARRFRRLCEKDGLFRALNFKEYHKKGSELRKLKREVGKKRAWRRMLRDNPLFLKTAHGQRKSR
jgi:small subunit ribosomal protein S21